MLTIAFFAAIAPTLTWQEFTGGMENFNVATAIETVRDGHWLLPYLQGEPRTKKPPLTQWITAVGLMSSQSKPWGARWPSLLMASLTLPAVYELGRVVGGRKLALLSALICGSSFMFLKFAHQASYDVQLALWVTLCNLCIASAIFRGRWMFGFVAAGIALGLALMTKGPVAILQTVVPVVVWIGWRVVRATRARACDGNTDGLRNTGGAPVRLIALAALAGLALALAISLPWTIWVLRKLPGLPSQWAGEVTLSLESKFEQRFGWHSYLVFIPDMFPWLVWFGAGIWLALKSKVLNPRLQLIFFWLLVPVLVMTFFPERRDRYLLPMIGPAAIVSAWAMLRILGRTPARMMPAGQSPPPPQLNTPRAAVRGLGASGKRDPALLDYAPPNVAIGHRHDQIPQLLVRVQWSMLVLVCIALPIAGATLSRRADDGGRWYSPAFAAVAMIIGLWLVFWGYRAIRGSWKGLLPASFALMLFAHGLYYYGYAQSRDGKSEAKVFVERLRQRYPDAQFVNANHRGCPLEFAIYLNRVVPTVDDPAVLHVEGRPLVVFDREKEMPLPPAGFSLLDSMMINKERWNAYVRVGR